MNRNWTMTRVADRFSVNYDKVVGFFDGEGGADDGRKARVECLGTRVRGQFPAAANIQGRAVTVSNIT
jgi:hypothetical protein